MPIELKKKNLFDCYVCGEEKINCKFKTLLVCNGSEKHTDFICQFCWKKNGKICPICRDTS